MAEYTPIATAKSSVNSSAAMISWSVTLRRFSMSGRIGRSPRIDLPKLFVKASSTQ